MKVIKPLNSNFSSFVCQFTVIALLIFLFSCKKSDSSTVDPQTTKMSIIQPSIQLANRTHVLVSSYDPGNNKTISYFFGNFDATGTPAKLTEGVVVDSISHSRMNVFYDDSLRVKSLYFSKGLVKDTLLYLFNYPDPTHVALRVYSINWSTDYFVLRRRATVLVKADNYAISENYKVSPNGRNGTGLFKIFPGLAKKYNEVATIVIDKVFENDVKGCGQCQEIKDAVLKAVKTDSPTVNTSEDYNEVPIIPYKLGPSPNQQIENTQLTKVTYYEFQGSTAGNFFFPGTFANGKVTNYGYRDPKFTLRVDNSKNSLIDMGGSIILSVQTTQSVATSNGVNGVASLQESIEPIITSVKSVNGNLISISLKSLNPNAVFRYTGTLNGSIITGTFTVTHLINPGTKSLPMNLNLSSITNR